MKTFYKSRYMINGPLSSEVDGQFENQRSLWMVKMLLKEDDRNSFKVYGPKA